jgi:hypothetical protein
VLSLLIEGVLAYWVVADCGDVLAVLCLRFFAEINSATWIAKQERDVCWCSGAERDGREEIVMVLKKTIYIYIKKK